MLGVLCASVPSSSAVLISIEAGFWLVLTVSASDALLQESKNSKAHELVWLLGNLQRVVTPPSNIQRMITHLAAPKSCVLQM